MNSEWLNTLTQQGANLSDETVADFGDPQAELSATLEADVICDLSHRALVWASGDDSSTFLQGQLSNDLRQVSASHHQLSSYCSPKGRMLALFRLFQRDNAYYLSLPRELIEPTLKRLQMFVLMSRVTLEDASDSLVHFGLSGANAEQLLKNRLGEFPAAPDDALTVDDITLLRVAGPHPRFELYGETAAMQGLWSSLAKDARKVGARGWELLDIHAGLPNVYRETAEAFVPQMLNLQLVNGVSFKKGCYTGQEVVARMQYLGKLKRRMYLAHAETATLPVPGTELSSPSSASGQGAGKVVRAAASPKGGYDMLCVIEIAAADSEEIYLGNESKVKLELQPLPYSFEQSETSPQAAG